MALRKADCTSIEVEEGTLGGDTYFVRHPKWDDEERAICFRPVKNIPGYDRANMFCERIAGHRTDHSGQGACRTHGGQLRDNGSFKNGSKSIKTKQHLAFRVKQYTESGDKDKLLNLDAELATMKILFQDMIEMFPADIDSPDYGRYAQQAITMVKVISDVIDKISKIESRNAITVNQIMYLRVRIAHMFVKYIEDPAKRELALQDLVSSMPGGDESSILSGEAHIIDQKRIRD